MIDRDRIVSTDHLADGPGPALVQRQST